MSQPPIKFCLPEKNTSWLDKNAVIYLQHEAFYDKWSGSSQRISMGQMERVCASLARQVAEGQPIALPHLSTSKFFFPDQPFRIDFVDGRHRSSFLLSQRLREVPVLVEKQQLPLWLEAGFAREATESEVAEIKRNGLLSSPRHGGPSPDGAAR